MDLQTLWFGLITILFTGYFILEGFDFGVGILLPFLGKDNESRRQLINTIGPHWDGNEVWLITAGGAMFAAFPLWYATLFSGFYLALFLILVALIIRGVAFEFRGKMTNPRWRSAWDGCIFFGSLIPALLWGVALTNLLQGVPIDGNLNYVGTFGDLLNPLSLLGGVVSLLGFTYHGALFLSLKTTAPMSASARMAAYRLWIAVFISLTLYAVVLNFLTSIPSAAGLNPIVFSVLALLAVTGSGWLLRSGKNGWSFITGALGIVFSSLTIFMALFPRVMVSSLAAANSLTIYNAASGAETLKIMTIVAAIFVPIVLVYQGWTYWVFRKRISTKPEDLHY